MVPATRTLGEVDKGWSIAMDLLPYERSTAIWHRGAYLHERFRAAAHGCCRGQLTAQSVGEAFLQLYAFRARSRHTQYRMAAGETLGAETSIDKVLLAAAEQSIFDLAADGLAGRGAARRRRRRAASGGRSTCTRERRRSTAAPRRSSAMSSPGGCSISERTADGCAWKPIAALFAQSLRQATEQHTGAALDAALADLGWHDALDGRPHRRCGAAFRVAGQGERHLGGAGRRAGRALGVGPARRSCCRRWGSGPPAGIRATDCSSRGLPPQRLVDRKRAVVAVDQDGTQRRGGRRRATRRADRSPGSIPELGLVEVTAISR